jgi:tetratricopeptide (TPR) repeat protein
MNKDLARTRASKSAFWVSAVAQFLEFKGRSSEAAAVYRQALDSLKAAHGPDHPKTKIVAEELARFLHRLGKKDEASLVRHELQVEHLLTRSDPGSLLALREVAYGAFSSGCFVQAEVCYRHLLAHNFEPPGTHCHLARVLIALGRDADAAAEVGRAWECRPEDEPYIILRILFFKALLATLAARDAQAPLTMLKQLLRDHPTATHPWRIAPVLERIRPRLTPPSHAFFTQLSQAITGNSAE